MRIFDTQFNHAISAGTPYLDTILPFIWDRHSNVSKNEPTIFTESQFHESKHIDNNCKILWILESPAFVPYKLKTDIINNHKDFKYILSHDEDICKLSNSIKFPIGGCWIKPNDALLYPKIKNSISLIASNKSLTEGQQLRHKFSNNNSVTMFGPNYKHLNYKLEALKSFQFHICPENTRNDIYFTEKIIDCFAVGTIPIYWGCNKIADYFNSNGIIEVDNESEILYVINNLSDFKINQKAIEENYNLSKNYWLPEDRILSLVNSFL